MRTLIAAIALLIALPASAAAHVVEKKKDDNIDRVGSYVSSINDKRIQESSGLAYSSKFPDIAYTNDDEDGPIYTIQPSTGKVVGTIKLDGVKLGDPESIYVDPYGHLWIGDLGDNKEDRHDTAIYAFNEPGAGNFEVKDMLKFPVSYEGGPTNVESMMINPISGQVYLIHKSHKAKDATLFELPNPLKNGEDNYARNTNKPMPVWASDGEFTPDGRRALVRTNTALYIYDPTDWSVMKKIATRKMQQSESVTIEPDQTTVLLGSEGKDSPLVRVDLPADPRPAPTATPTTSALSDLGDFQPVPAGGPQSPLGVSLKSLVGLVVIGGLVVGVGTLVWLRVALRRRRRLKRIRRM